VHDTEGGARGAPADLVGRMAGEIHRFMKRHRAFDVAAVWVSRRVREAPPGSLLHKALGPLRAQFRGEMKESDLLAVVSALEGAELRYWIAGGWGVDVLRGHQTRRHDDLDVILADYAGDEPVARRALAALGYRRTEVLDGLWMDPRSLFDDGAGHQIEILGLDRPRLDVALEWTGEPGRAPLVEDRNPELFTTGEVAGRTVPCLAVELQLLFHSGFEARGVDGPDIELLRAMAAADGHGDHPTWAATDTAEH